MKTFLFITLILALLFSCDSKKEEKTEAQTEKKPDSGVELDKLNTNHYIYSGSNLYHLLIKKSPLVYSLEGADEQKWSAPIDYIENLSGYKTCVRIDQTPSLISLYQYIYLTGTNKMVVKVDSTESEFRIYTLPVWNAYYEKDEDGKYFLQHTAESCELLHLITVSVPVSRLGERKLYFNDVPLDSIRTHNKEELFPEKN